MSFLLSQCNNWAPPTENVLTAQSQKVHQFVSHIIRSNGWMQLFKMEQERKEEPSGIYIFCYHYQIMKSSYFYTSDHIIEWNQQKKRHDMRSNLKPIRDATGLFHQLNPHGWHIFIAWDCNQDPSTNLSWRRQGSVADLDITFRFHWSISNTKASQGNRVACIVNNAGYHQCRHFLTSFCEESILHEMEKRRKSFFCF